MVGRQVVWPVMKPSTPIQARRCSHRGQLGPTASCRRRDPFSRKEIRTRTTRCSARPRPVTLARPRSTGPGTWLCRQCGSGRTPPPNTAPRGCSEIRTTPSAHPPIRFTRKVQVPHRKGDYGRGMGGFDGHVSRVSQSAARYCHGIRRDHLLVVGAGIRDRRLHRRGIHASRP